MRNIFRKKPGAADYAAQPSRSPLRFLAPVFVLAVVLLVMSNAVEVIPSGYTGVVTTFVQIQENTMPNGFNWKITFVQ